MTATFYVGDAIEAMNKLPEKSVDLVLTSPPFLALRSYLPSDHPHKALEGGSQATPGAFIDWLVDVVEACDRVLAPHGSLCIELGDTYAGSGGAGSDYNADGLREGQPKFRQAATWGDAKWSDDSQSTRTSGSGKGTGWPLAKSLSLIPELFRFTLVYGTNPLTGRQTERWRLRNVVRWVRPNPPVGALGDKFRPATSELMVFCKSAKRYFDLDAVREPFKPETLARFADGKEMHYDKAASAGRGGGWSTMPEGKITTTGAPPLDWWNIPPGGYEGAHYAVFPPELCIKPIKAMCPEKVCKVCGEPSRPIYENVSVPRRTRTPDPTTIGGFLQTHRLKKGLTVKQVAEVVGVASTEAGHWFRSDAGARLPDPDQWVMLRLLLPGLPPELDDLMAVTPANWPNVDHGNRSVPLRLSGGPSAGALTKVVAVGFSDCAHDDWRPGVVLDPFGGSGTTALVATGHGRDCILIDLDERNFDLALQRVGPFILERAS